MSGQATILHADLDSFFASVEQRDDPRLRGKPTIVGGGVVLAASYEAKAFGVQSAMGGRRARQLCPHAIVVEPHFDAYVDASRAVFAVFRDTAPLVEALSIDEAFLDVRGLERISGTPRRIAARLRRDVRERVGLPITVGVARTKFLAKVASAQAKPDGLLVVAPDRELDFLHPLPVDAVWGVGPATAAKLREHGLERVGQVARLERAVLVELLGRAAGAKVHALANNRDPRPVRAGPGRRSFGSQSAIGRGPHTPESIDASLLALADRVTRRMRAAGRRGRTVTLRLRFGDFGARATRSQTLTRATADTATVLAVARGLLAAAMPLIDARGITLVGIAVANIESGRRPQLALPLDGRGRLVDGVLDAVRDRYGTTAITRAALVGRGPRLATWLFPGEDASA